MVNTINEYDYNTQSKIVASLILDREFLSDISDKLEPAYFENRALKWLIEQIYSYFNEYKTPPTWEVFKIQISNLKHDTLFKDEVLSCLKDVFFHTKEATDLQFIKDRIFEFCRHQLIKNAYPESIELLQKGMIDEAVEVLIAARQKGQKTESNGLDYLKDIDVRYTEIAENPRVKTGWEVIDDIMGGGLPKGKFGIVMAPTGVGKSWILCQLGAAALKLGKVVVHYTLELDANYVARRYDSIMTGITFDDLKYNISQIKRTISKFSGKLIIKEFPPSTLSIRALETDIKRLKLLGIVPDLVVLDYPELLIIPYNTNMREDKVLGELYKDLRGLCGREGFALWGCDQTNRSGLDKDVIENDSVSNSFAKLFALDFMMSVSRRPKDKINNVARLHISKNRLGPDGMTFPMRFDTSVGKFEVYNENTTTGKTVKTKEMMTDDEYGLQLASQRVQNALNSHKQEPQNMDLF